MTVQSLINVVWTVFEKFEFSLKGREKMYEYINSRSFFRLAPKNLQFPTDLKTIQNFGLTPLKVIVAFCQKASETKQNTSRMSPRTGALMVQKMPTQ